MYVFDDTQIGVRDISDPIYAQNVYEWHGGHVYLISDGRDASPTAGIPCPCLLGTDASAANVFFSTVDQLSTQDTDTELDYYDARICTEADPCIKPPPARVECQADACQGSPVPQPPLASAASVTFAGPGNASPGGPAPPAGKVKILSHTVHGSSFLLTVRVPGKGRISISGAGVGALRRSVAGAGTYRFAVSLTAKARASMRRHHRHRLRLKLRVGFTPSGGSPSSASVSVTVRI